MCKISTTMSFWQNCLENQNPYGNDHQGVLGGLLIHEQKQNKKSHATLPLNYLGPGHLAHLLLLLKVEEPEQVGDPEKPH